ncbi:MAG: hypothetical protein JWP12_2313 [Bacteroidetes bacterium]|nr:hypothetical protein [Bacteroidota bacterium]
MSILKNIPIKYKGELHDVKLINFSVDMEEVKNSVPKGIRILDVEGRAMISMVDVQLKNMHPTFVPEQFCFNYRHIAFRLLVDDSEYSGEPKGIYFLRSFTNKPLIVQGGKWFTNYNLETAELESFENMLELKQEDNFLNYAFRDRSPVVKNESLKRTIGNIDRAYSLNGKQLQFVQILREKWPIEWIDCYHFQTNFFKTAQVECAFKVAETIHYQWLPPQNVNYGHQLITT